MTFHWPQILLEFYLPPESPWKLRYYHQNESSKLVLGLAQFAATVFFFGIVVESPFSTNLPNSILAVFKHIGKEGGYMTSSACKTQAFVQFNWSFIPLQRTGIGT